MTKHERRKGAADWFQGGGQRGRGSVRFYAVHGAARTRQSTLCDTSDFL